MGREVKRVPLDFDWPMNTTWHGFLMPDDLRGIQCEHCEGSGSSPEMRMLKDKWYGYRKFDPRSKGSEPYTADHPTIIKRAQRNYPDARNITFEAERLAEHFNSWCHHLSQEDVDALIVGGRLTGLTSRWDGDRRKWIPTGHHPSAKEVNEWSIDFGFGHDSINQWIVCGAEADRNGWSTTCVYCNGEGETWRDDAHKAAHDGWESFGPPEGEGWQMWENTSEGSAISPVFDTPEKLARYVTDHPYGAHAGTYDQWMEMIKGSGWAMDAVMVDGVMMSGVEAGL